MSIMEVYNTKQEKNNLLQIFNFEDYKVRVIFDSQGEPWFIARDVSKILGHSSTNDATRILDEDEKGFHVMRTLGGPQRFTTVNESGLYSLVFLSRKPEAKKFKKWVTNDVLPTIRKTGGYGQKIDFSDSKLLHTLLVNYTDRVSKLEHEVEINQPKVDFYDDFINSDGLYTLQNAARALSYHPNLFIDSLKSHYLFYQGKALVPYQRYRDQGLFVVKSNIIDGKARCQTYITTKGLQYFAEHTYIDQINNDNSNYQSTTVNY